MSNVKKSHYNNNNFNRQSTKMNFNVKSGKINTDVDENFNTHNFNNFQQDGHIKNCNGNLFSTSTDDMELTDRIAYLKSIVDKAPKLHLEVRLILNLI